MNLEILNKIENVGSSIEKARLLKEFLITGGNFAEEFIRTAVDKTILFNLKETNMFNAFDYNSEKEGSYKDIGEYLFKFDWPHIPKYHFLEWKESIESIKALSGNNQLQAFKNEMMHYSKLDRKWLSRCIKHDLDMGISIKTVNHVFQEIGLKPVNKYDVQKAGKFKNWRNQEEVHKRISFPCAGEYKYDGFRAELRKRDNKIILMSRRGKTIYYAPEILYAAEEALQDFDEIILDGELVCYDEKWSEIDFNEMQKRSNRKWQNQLPRNISFMLFDVLSINGKELEDEKHEIRKNTLKKLFYEFLNNLPMIKYQHGKDWSHEIRRPFSLSEEFIILNYEQAVELYIQSRELKFEGIILKKFNSFYTRGDRKNWWKIKASSKDNLRDATLKVIGEKFGSGKNHNVISSLLVIDSSELIETWCSNMKENEMQEATRRHTNKQLIGSFVDVSYMEISKVETPYRLRHPIMERFRDDKEQADSLVEEI